VRVGAEEHEKVVDDLLVQSLSASVGHRLGRHFQPQGLHGERVREENFGGKGTYQRVAKQVLFEGASLTNTQPWGRGKISGVIFLLPP
jgi:hypothetical protein